MSITTLLRLGIIILPLALLPAGPAQGDDTAGSTADIPPPSSSVSDDSADDFDDDFEDDEPATPVADPLQGFNRAMFWVNDKLYFFLLKPVARVVRIIPEPARISLSNFFSNLGTPIRLINAGLQLKFHDAGNELKRFVVNSTIGIGGLFDPAKNWLGIAKKKEDTGQTFGYYGIGSGPYLVIPVIGPTNFRDGIGLLADFYLHPVTYIVDEFSDILIIEAIDYTNNLSLDKDTYESIKKDALDPYLFIRDAYTQMREGRIKK